MFSVWGSYSYVLNWSNSFKFPVFSVFPLVLFGVFYFLYCTIAKFLLKFKILSLNVIIKIILCSQHDFIELYDLK